jgi:hypothetical protein
MSISRRFFLKTGSLVAVAAGFPLKALAGEAGRETGSNANSVLSRRIELEAARLNSAAFTRCLNTQFRIHRRNADAVVLKLDEVSHWQKTSAPTDRECFSALFSGPDRAPLNQDTYEVEHHSLGKFQVLLVPIGRNKQGLRYEAVFNRLH